MILYTPYKLEGGPGVEAHAPAAHETWQRLEKNIWKKTWKSWIHSPGMS
jgi:hypothetical protein